MVYFKKHESAVLDALESSRHNTAHKMGRVSAKIASLLPQSGLRPKLFEKIAQWMEQLTLLHKKEQDILDQILTVEDIHKKQRKGKLLRKAKPVAQETNAPIEPVTPLHRKGVWALVLAILLMEPSRKKSHPQLKND